MIDDQLSICLRHDVYSHEEGTELQPDDGVDPWTFFKKPSRRGANRKALQLCSQIAQTLTSVLDWETGDERLRGLTVQSAPRSRPEPGLA